MPYIQITKNDPIYGEILSPKIEITEQQLRQIEQTISSPNQSILSNPQTQGTDQQSTTQTPEECVHRMLKSSNFTFSRKGIKVGEEIAFTEDITITATVANDTEVLFEGKLWKEQSLRTDIEQVKPLFNRGKCRLNGVLNAGDVQ